MTRRQAVIEALQHHEHDTIPFHMDFTKQALDQLIAYTGDEQIEEKSAAISILSSIGDGPRSCPTSRAISAMNSALSGTATARTKTSASWNRHK